MRSELSDLTTTVCELLLKSYEIGHAMIEVEEAEGIITLRGTYESEDEKSYIEAIVLEQQGVRKVINQLKIRPE
jgi:osmotically-inducible protein OsmY